MRSRLLIGACGWLLGAAAATCGSMLAVSHLAHGLLGPGTQQLSAEDVRNDLASMRHSGTSPTATATLPPTRAAARPSQSARTAPAGTLLVSQAGSAMASCRSGLAYLQYWSPDQGYQADEVYRGPAARASITFEAPGGAVRMAVTCAGGQPVDRLSSVVDDHERTGDE